MNLRVLELVLGRSQRPLRFRDVLFLEGGQQLHFSDLGVARLGQVDPLAAF